MANEPIFSGYLNKIRIKVSNYLKICYYAVNLDQCNQLSMNPKFHIYQNSPLSLIIEHILQRYHEVHRQQFANILPLAGACSGYADFPSDLLSFLQTFAQDLENHLQKEEQILFPLINAGRGQMATMPVRVMMMEHDNHQASLSQLSDLTNDLTLPENAAGNWRQLYEILQQFRDDLLDHIDIENELLFPRALNE